LRGFDASESCDSHLARPLKRAIQEHLLDPHATKLLAGKFKPNDKINVSANGDSLVFETRWRVRWHSLLCGRSVWART